MSVSRIKAAIRMTDAYKKHKNSHPAIRETAFLSELYPALRPTLSMDDTFAGALGEHKQSELLPLVFSPQFNAQIGFSMNLPLLRSLSKEHPEYERELSEIMDFWLTESTFVKIRSEAPKDVHDYLFPHGTELDADGYYRKSKKGRPVGSGFISGSYDTRIAGIMPDFAKLIRLGIPGLYKEIQAYSEKNPYCPDYYTAAKNAVDIMKSLCIAYKEDAVALGLTECADVLDALISRPPETLREGIQLILIFTTITHVENYGRLDNALAPLLAADLREKRLDFEGIITLLCEFWRVFEKWGSNYDSRIILGGKGRSDEENANLFALCAMEATRRRHAIVPVLTLRLYKGQDPELFDKALELIGNGCIYPTLYNDDAYIDGAAKAMHLPYEHAERYVPLGCGELTLDHTAIGSPNSTFRFPKALEAALHNGRDGITGEQIGIKTGELSDFTSYNDLENALFRQIESALSRDVHVHLWNREITIRETAYVHASLLTDCCLEKGLGLHAGVRYFGANVEGFGQTNTANSLAAIKKFVYEEKRFTLSELVEISDKNFEGFDEVNSLLRSAPKFGNNLPYVDEIKKRLCEFINRTADRIGRENGLHYYTVAAVNPGGILCALRVGAGADGRKCGEPMALGNSPHPGTDRSGLTAMLISAAKEDSANGGVVTNVNISRETVLNSAEAVKSAFLTYFEMGGLQLNVNCFSRGDLERALEAPSLYPNLIVRVSGYSARFTDLDKVTQRHIMNRTLY